MIDTPNRDRRTPYVFPVNQRRCQSVRIAAYNDQSYGFLRVTIAARKLAGETFAVEAQELTLSDAFVLDMDTHRVYNESSRPDATGQQYNLHTVSLPC